MKIDKCLFVCGSDVFRGCRETWLAFSESDPDCSWGNNNRSLVSRDFLLTALDEVDAKGVEVVRERIERLPVEVYIDLEN
jgi:hypothetical protein